MSLLVQILWLGLVIEKHKSLQLLISEMGIENSAMYDH